MRAVHRPESSLLREKMQHRSINLAVPTLAALLGVLTGTLGEPEVEPLAAMVDAFRTERGRPAENRATR